MVSEVRMIVATLSLDSMLARTKFLRNISSARIGNLDEILKEFDQVFLLTQDTINFTDYLRGATHVPCSSSPSRRVEWVLSRFVYARWAYFFFYSFFWMLKHRKKISLLVSINVDSPAPLFSMLFGIPCIVYYHYDTAFQVKHINGRPVVGSVLDAVERLAFRNAIVVWITSPSLMDKVKSLGAKRIKLIPNWIDVKEIEGIKVPRRRSTRPRILFVGRLHRVKRVDLLIRAFHLIHERNSHVDLYILGDGDQRQALVKLANDLGLSGNIHFLGYVDQTAVFRMMKLSDVFVLPSKIEGNPRVIIEAMANKVPIVATSVPGIKDMVQHMKTGYLIDTDTPEKLAQGIEYILSNKRESASMTSRAYGFVLQNFSKENVSQQIRDELKLFL